MNTTTRTLLVIYISFLSLISFSQVGSNSNFYTAKQLFVEKNYVGARALFKNENYGPNSLQGKEANIYIMQCDLFLNKEEAANEIIHFLEVNPNSVYGNDLRFALAQKYYENKDYKSAANYYAQCDVNLFKAKDQHLYYFESAYSAMQNGNTINAEKFFALCKQLPGKYQDAASYYYAYILFKNKKYENAEAAFNGIPHGSRYATLVPYYQSCILFNQEKYVDCIEAGEKYLEEQRASDLDSSIFRIIGLAYYKQENYEKAIVFLSKYPTIDKIKRRQDLYTLGVSYYQLERFSEAIVCFKQVISYDDDLAQSSNLYLGHSYLKLKELSEAKQFYKQASLMNHDRGVKEQATYNSLKLNYASSGKGDQQLLDSFHSFFKDYPKSNYTEELNELLVSYLAENKMYETAYKLIKQNQNPSEPMNKTMQVVAYWRGVSYYEKNKLEEAVESYSTSLQYGKYDSKLQALALYWRAESNYRLDKKTEAQRDYNAFLSQKDAPLTDIYSMAYYSLAYCQFGDKKYIEAKLNYERFVTLADKDPAMKRACADAYNRIGDCDFLQRQFAAALVSYNLIINRAEYGVDYALFQRAFIYGLNKEEAKKLSELQFLISQYPNSSYADDAQYEIGKSYANTNNWKKAIESYDLVISHYSQSSIISKVLLQRALAYYNLNDKNQAKLSYRSLLEKYPNSPESEMAINGLKNIAIEQNKVPEYLDYVNQLGISPVQVDEVDAMTYQSAEKRYMAGDLTAAKEDLTNYITQFPQGSYLNNAYFYRADSYEKSNQQKEALFDYMYIIEKPQCSFTEDALSHASLLLMKDGRYSEALTYYTQLENLAESEGNKIDAKLGQLRCYYALGNWTKVIDQGTELQEEKRLSESDMEEIYFKQAKSELALNKTAEAKKTFLKIADSLSTIHSAESQYQIAQIDYDSKNLSASEKRINDFIPKGSEYPYWLARNFILLSDINQLKGDKFKAKQYLISLKDNYQKEDDILSMVESRLAALESGELKN